MVLLAAWFAFPAQHILKGFKDLCSTRISPFYMDVLYARISGHSQKERLVSQYLGFEVSDFAF